MPRPAVKTEGSPPRDGGVVARAAFATLLPMHTMLIFTPSQPSGSVLHEHQQVDGFNRNRKCSVYIRVVRKHDATRKQELDLKR